MPSVNEILHADRLRLQSLYETGARPINAAAASTSDSIPIARNDDTLAQQFSGTLFYIVVGYGTPAQQFSVAFDTAAGFSFLRCKPCKAADSPSLLENSVFAECNLLCRVSNIGHSAKKNTRQRSLCREPGTRQSPVLGKDGRR
jgi:hypothetical protein